MASESRTAVVAALLVSLALTALKSVAAAFSGSAAMLAETCGGWRTRFTTRCRRDTLRSMISSSRAVPATPIGSMRRRDGPVAAHRLQRLQRTAGCSCRLRAARHRTRDTLRIERRKTLPPCDEFASQRAA